MPAPDISFQTHAETIAPYRRWLDPVVNSCHVVYLALAFGSLYVSIFIGDTPSPIRRLVLALILLGITAVSYYLVGIRRKSTSCLVIAVLCLITALRSFNDGGVMDYLLTGLTVYHLAIYLPVLMLDPEFAAFRDNESRKKVIEDTGGKP